MKSLRHIIRESINLAENMQQADKVYFNSGLLSPDVKRIIVHITGGDAYTKLISDIYYAEQQQSIRQGRWALAHISGDDDEVEDPQEKGHLTSQSDVMPIEDLKKLKAMYEQLKTYNKNVFPIKGLTINGVADIWDLIRALNQRASVLKEMAKLPSVAKRNMQPEIRQERNSKELQDYRAKLEYFVGLYSQLSNRGEKLRKDIQNKMFVSNVTLEDLIDFAEEKENLLGGKKFTKNSLVRIINENSDDLEIVYNKGSIMVIDVTAPEGIKLIGCNSLWCFTYGKGFEAAYSQWNRYSTNDHVYAIVDFSVPSDSPYFMHVLIKPLDYSVGFDDAENENDSKLFNMANEEVYNPLVDIDKFVGLQEAPFIFNFGEPVNAEGPSSKWPHEDPNQTKLDLKEIRKLIKLLLPEIIKA